VVLIQLAVGESRGKSAGEDLTCDLKSLFVTLISAVQCGSEQLVNCGYRLGQMSTK
jgi:hypothetical protein